MKAEPIFTTAEVAATALWTGASAGFAFVSAPLAFKLVPDREQFASITEGTLARLTTLANVAGGIAVAAAILRKSPLRAAFGLSALGLLAYHQRTIVPSMSREHVQIGTPEYDRLHQQSTRVFGSALMLGVAQLTLAAV